MTELVSAFHKSHLSVWMEALTSWPKRIRQAYVYQPQHQYPKVFLFLQAWKLL